MKVEHFSLLYNKNKREKNKYFFISLIWATCPHASQPTQKEKKIQIIITLYSAYHKEIV